MFYITLGLQHIHVGMDGQEIGGGEISLTETETARITGLPYLTRAIC